MFLSQDSISPIYSGMGNKAAGWACFELWFTYGPSVHVKAWEKPHERTSCSNSRCDFAIVVEADKVSICVGFNVAT